MAPRTTLRALTGLFLLLELPPRTRTTYAGPLVLGEDLMTIPIGERVGRLLGH